MRTFVPLRFGGYSILIAAVAFFSLQPLVVKADSSPAEALYDQGNAALQAQDYAGAIKAYNVLIDQYPSVGFAADARLSLGIAQLDAGQPQEALASFIKLIDPQIREDLRADAILYAGHAEYAAASTASTDKQAPLFGQANQYFSQYLNEFPQGEQREDALFAQAQICFYQGNYDAMQVTLSQLLTSYPDSDSQIDYLYWSGHGYAAQAATFQGKDPIKTADFAQKALASFAKINESGQAILAANAARLEAMDLENTVAQSDADYEKVIADSRDVVAKGNLISKEQGILEQTSKQIGQAAQSADKPLYQRLTSQRERQQEQLAAIQAGSDPKIEGVLRMAQALIHLHRYDEARVSLTYILSFADDKEKETAHYLIILTYALQNQIDKADIALHQHQADFPNDPNAQNLRVLIASTLQKNGDDSGAETQYRKALVEYPDGSIANEAVLGLAKTLLKEKKEAEVVPLLTDFLKKSPSGSVAAEARYDLGMAFTAQKRYDEALEQFNLVAMDANAGAWQENAALQSGFTLLNQGKYDDSIQVLKDLIAKFPDTESAGAALFYEGLAQEKKSDSTAALATYEQILKDHSKQTMAPMAAQRMIAIYQTAGKTDDMKTLAERLQSEFPDSPSTASVALAVAESLEKARDYDHATTEYSFVASRLESPLAQTAQARLATMWFTAGKSLGSYSALDDNDRKAWTSDMGAGEKAAIEALHRFPASREAGLALEELIKLTILKRQVGLFTPEQALAYFVDLGSQEQSSILKGRFQLAGIALRPGASEDEIVALYQKAATDHSDLTYDPEDLERYGAALLATKQYDQAIVTFQALHDAFPQEPMAQSEALYGLGAAQSGQGHMDEADKFFSDLEQKYPWSNKIWEAKLGRGKAAEDRHDTAQARTFYQQVIMAPGSSPEMKAQGLFGFAHCLETEGKLIPDPSAPDEPNAVNNYLKIDALFDSAPDVAAEGLWRAGQIFEKTKQPEKAHQAYYDLVKKYKNSPFAAQAQSWLSMQP